MHIAETTHEHSASSKVYTFEADYVLDASGVTWTAVVRQSTGWCRELTGSLEISGAAAATVAEQAVRDEIVRKIDSMRESG
jgi:hypothetical protein